MQGIFDVTPSRHVIRFYYASCQLSWCSASIAVAASDYFFPYHGFFFQTTGKTLQSILFVPTFLVNRMLPNARFRNRYKDHTKLCCSSTNTFFMLLVDAVDMQRCAGWLPTAVMPCMHLGQFSIVYKRYWWSWVGWWCWLHLVVGLTVYLSL